MAARGAVARLASRASNRKLELKFTHAAGKFVKFQFRGRQVQTGNWTHGPRMHSTGHTDGHPVEAASP